MITKDSITEQIDILESQCRALRMALSRSTKPTFLSCIDSAEKTLATLRALVIRHSRKLRTGLKKDGSPDMRFNRNRKPYDLRTN